MQGWPVVASVTDERTFNVLRTVTNSVISASNRCLNASGMNSDSQHDRTEIKASAGAESKTSTNSKSKRTVIAKTATSNSAAAASQNSHRRSPCIDISSLNTECPCAAPLFIAPLSTTSNKTDASAHTLASSTRHIPYPRGSNVSGLPASVSTFGSVPGLMFPVVDGEYTHHSTAYRLAKARAVTAVSVTLPDNAVNVATRIASTGSCSNGENSNSCDSQNYNASVSDEDNESDQKSTQATKPAHQHSQQQQQQH